MEFDKAKRLDVFTRHYASTGNGAESARIAGYKNGAIIANRLLKRPEVRATIDKIKQTAIVIAATDNVAKARILRSKDNWQAELISRLEQSTIGEHTRIVELFGKSEGFLSSDFQSPAINILNLSGDQLSDRAKRLIESIAATSINSVNDSNKAPSTTGEDSQAK